MNRAGQHSDPSNNDARDSSELDLAARVADKASEETHGGDVLPPDEQRTLARGPDAEYRQAIDEIAFLIDMRREASGLDTPIGEDAADAGDLSDIDLNGVNEWGPFELIERLGGGASGEVFKVRDKHLKNHVALKLFHLERVESDELDTVLVEGRQHALVKHPNIAVIHGADENDGRVGIWMEYIDGATLQKLVEEQDTFGPAEAVNIGRELCSALAAVHQQGLTHGDIKAQNVMREKGGRIVLMDFSSSRHVELDEDSAGGLVGTPIYMAPELFDDKPSDFRSDIYALGVLLFYLVTGRHPYEATNLKQLKEAVSARKPLLLDDLRSDLPSGFVHAVHKAISWNPDARFQSAGEFQAALRDAVVVDPSDRLTPHSPQPTPDLSALVRAARVVTWSVFVTAFLALLGYSNEFFFNLALNIPDKFTNYSLVTAAAVGLRTLGFPLVEGARWAVVLAVVWGLMRIVGGNRMSGAASRLVEKLERADFMSIASLFTLVSIASVAGTVFYFSDFLAAIAGISPGNNRVDLSLLRWACDGEPVHAIRFALGFSRVSLLLCLGWLVVFERLKPSLPMTSAARFMKWVSALAIVVALGVMATPWRLLWQNESLPIELDDTKGYIVAKEADELYVYSPEASAGERYLVLQRTDPRITSVGVTPTYIFGQESCGEGDES